MPWDANASSTLISAIFSTIIATLASVAITRKTVRNQDESKLHDEILQINMLAIEYPYFVDDAFCEKYDPAITTNEMLRYDSYCCILYNLFQKIWEHFKGDEKKMFDFFGFDEEVCRNKKWWLAMKNRREIVQGYPLEFVDFIDNLSK